MKKEDKTDIHKGIRSICSIIISIVSVLVSCQANSISNMQKEIALAENNPQFVVNEKQIYNDQHIVDNRVITVECDNGYFTNYSSEVVTILNIFCENNEVKNIPLVGYWFVHGKTGNTLGKIEEISAVDNHLKYSKLKKLIEEMYDNVLYVEIENYMNISYYDLMQNQQDRYYKISAIEGTNIVEYDSFLEKKKIYDEGIENRYYIDIDKYSEEDIALLNLSD